MTLETVLARPRHQAMAAVSALALGMVAVVALSWEGGAGEPRPWVAGIYLSAVVLLHLQIAGFLVLHVLAGSPTRALAWLSGGYWFAAICAAGQFFTYPGLVAPVTGPADPMNQASPFLWTLWHIGFPCAVLAAVAARSKPATSGGELAELGHRPIGDLLPAALGLAAGLLAVVLSIGYPEYLPRLIHGNDYASLVRSPLAGVLVALNALSLIAIVYVTRLREILFLWLALASFALTLDVVLSMVAAVRYSAEWYAGRFMGFVSSASLMIGLMIENFKLHRDAELRAAFHEYEAAHDPLTGLFNRRYLMDKLAEELARARRYRYPVSALLVDVDYFKRINDQYGHDAGDESLRALAGALGRRVSRVGDFAARYGGEEFVVVLPETESSGATEVAEEIRQRVEALHATGAAPYPITVSIGVATASLSDAVSAAEVLSWADRCLYRAKALGRNRVVSSAESAPRLGALLRA